MAWEKGGRTHPKTNLDNGPDDNRLAVCIRAQVLDREDADDLDDSDEEAEAEEGCEEDLYRKPVSYLISIRSRVNGCHLLPQLQLQSHQNRQR